MTVDTEALFQGKARTEWHGSWIWCEERAADRNVYAFFRRAFTLGAAMDCTVHITADSFYVLYVDGHFIARGPARSPLMYYSFDSHPLSLGPGRHVIAVLVHHVGEINATMMLGRPGLLADVVPDTETGAETISSDADWRCLKSDAWRQDLPEMMSHFGFWEDCDTRRIPRGWTAIDFDDAHWPRAVPIARPGDAPWPNLIARDIPTLRITEVPVLTVAARGTFRPGAGESGRPSVEVSRREYAPDHGQATLPHAFDADNGSCYLTLDFGRTVSGYPRLAFKDAAPGTIIDLSYDEMLTEEGAVDPERTYAHLTDRFVLAGGEAIVRPTHPRGFRYLMIGVSDPAGLSLRDARVLEETYPFTLTNRFQAADPQFEAFHLEAAETVRICTQDAFMDCPSRERVQWMEDMIMHGRVAATAFADTNMLRRSLFQAAQCQLPDGRINGFFPSERTNCAFAASSLMWMHMLADYWEFTGDEEDLARLRPSLRRLLRFLDGRADDKGILRSWPVGQFWEWAPISNEAGACLLLTNAFLCLAQERILATPPLADLLPESAYAELERRRGALHELFWVPGRHLYRDALPAASVRYSQSVNAAAVLAGICPPDLKAALLARILDRPQLGSLPRGESTPEKAPPADPEAIIPCGTLLMASIVCQALFENGMDTEALMATRAFWGAYAEQPTFPEVRVQGDNTGFCHGWSGGPAYFLPRYLLGVRPIRGWRRTRFAPHPGDQDYAEGRFLTPRGELKVRWERTKADRLRAELVIPQGIELEIEQTGEILTGPLDCTLDLSAAAM